GQGSHLASLRLVSETDWSVRYECARCASAPGASPGTASFQASRPAAPSGTQVAPAPDRTSFEEKTMLIRDVMQSRLDVVSPSETLADAARKMRDDDIGSLPVVEDANLIGIITDRDTVVRCVADGADPRSTTVREAASGDVVHCRADQSLEDASKIMASAKIRRLPVIDDDRRLVGIVALADL